MDAAAIEDLNKVRKAMGLKPLPVPNAAPAQPRDSSKDDEEAASTIDTRQAAAGDNYRKHLDEEKAKKDREARLAAIKKEREKAQRLATLKGQGLGDLDDEDAGDAKSWLKSMKKKQKKIAESRQREEEEEAAKAAAAKAAGYSSKDLAGVKVAHDMSALLDGDDQVLTLKDTTVLDEEEGDELENMNLREQEKLNEKLDLKKKKPVYDPNDIDETGDRSILAQYDEEIDGKKKKKTFTLDGKGTFADLADILEGPAQRQKKTLQNLDVDMLQDAPVSDYLDASEIKVKKPKKKKKSKVTRQRDEADALFPGDQVDDDIMDIDIAPVTKKRKALDENFVDDDDLQTSLTLQRRQALKKQKRVRPEDLAKQLKAEAEQEAEQGDEGIEAGGLVIDETTEFLSAINKPDLDDETRPRRKSKSREPLTAMEAEPSDEEMENAPQIKEESPERDLSATQEDLTTTGVEEEKYVAQGLGATLSLLKERNIIDEKENGAEKNENFRQRQLFLAEQSRLVAQVDEEAKRQRERDRASGHLDRMSARDREEYARRQNADREFKLSSIRANLLKKYRFNVELKYVDEQGRHLNQKEAFKELSHQFHGKTSGKGKTDKKLSKIEQEKSRMAKSIFDASQEAGMSSAMAQQTKKRKEAGVRLA